jgi:hypothetical protein
MSAGEGESAFAALAERFDGEPGVESGTGFGSAPGLRVGGKIFAMLPYGELVVKLPAERCQALANSGAARPFVSGKRTMREWVVLEAGDSGAWADLAGEALAYVRG